MSESNRKCNRCSKLCEVLSESTSRCREWSIESGGVVKERYFERESDGCLAYKKIEERKPVIETCIEWSEGFVSNARRWRGKGNAKNNIQ